MPLRIAAGVIGAFFLLQGVNWLVAPQAAAEALGMPYLDGLGRSTQVGDLSGFFLCLGGMALFGAIRVRGTWIRASGCLVGIVAVTRTIAWAAHGAEFAATFIGIEILAGGALLYLAGAIDRLPDASQVAA